MSNKTIQVSVPEAYFIAVSRIAHLQGDSGLSTVACHYLMRGLQAFAAEELSLLHNQKLAIDFYMEDSES